MRLGKVIRSSSLQRLEVAARLSSLCSPAAELPWLSAARGSPAGEAWHAHEERPFSSGQAVLSQSVRCECLQGSILLPPKTCSRDGLALRTAFFLSLKPMTWK